MAIDFLDELRWRGLIHQCTDEAGLAEHLRAGPRRAYCGFDPTADSLTIGNLVAIMLLVHFARAGHEPVVLMGGGTGLIGDPSGKSAERQLRTREEIASHVESQRSIFERVFAGAGLGTPAIVNNLDWLGGLRYIDALRDVGKHFSVNMMMQKDSVKSRLENREQGISYTEFSYMILQAYDFLHLYKDQGVTIQFGGSDQYGNIVAGTDLIRRVHARPGDAGRGVETFGLTAPLLTKADGGKFGKTESGAVWLSPHRTSPYAMYQFWLNTADADAGRFLRVFTLLGKEEIEAIEAEHTEAPGKRAAQRALAERATSLVHGEEAAAQAAAAGRALFSGDLSGLDEATLAEVFAGLPGSEHPRAALERGVDPVELLVETGLAESKKKAREFLAAGSVSASGRTLGPEDRVTAGDLLHGRHIALRRGKKAWHLTTWA